MLFRMSSGVSKAEAMLNCMQNFRSKGTKATSLSEMVSKGVGSKWERSRSRPPKAAESARKPASWSWQAETACAQPFVH